MRRSAFLFGLFSLVLLAGCQLTSQERVAALRGAIAKTNELSVSLNDKIVLWQDALMRAEAMLADPNMTSATLAKIREDIALLRANIAKALPVKEMLDKKMAAYEQLLAVALAAGPMDEQDEFAAYGQGVATFGGALPPPFNLIALFVGTILLPAIGYFIKGRKDKVAIGGIVGSVSALLADGKLVPDPEAAKSLLAREQVKVPAAAAAVRAQLTKAA